LVAVLHLFSSWKCSLGEAGPADVQAHAGCQSLEGAANQGLYNGFLVAGLVWGLSLGHAGNPIKIFFLGCVIVAGVFGALTVNRRILWVQALPGAMALALVLGA
jgi:uncharacterized membrane protein